MLEKEWIIRFPSLSYSDWLFQMDLCQPFADETVLTKEITCVGKGDSECIWMTRGRRKNGNPIRISKKNFIIIRKHQ